MLNDAGEEAMRYNLYETWPVKYHGPALNARNSAHATEALEIAFETFEMK
jgi:phage tail-like protein